MKKIIPFLGIGFLLGGLAAWIFLNSKSADLFFPSGETLLPAAEIESGSRDEQAAPRAGSSAPDFELQTIDNRTIRLSDLRGHPVLVNFWATWCGPCRIEMPTIQSRLTEYAPDLKVLAVNYDEAPQNVQAFAEELNLEIDVLLDPDGKVNEEDYLVRAYPSSYFIDRDGIIQVVHLGLMTEDQLDDYLERIGVATN